MSNCSSPLHEHAFFFHLSIHLGNIISNYVTSCCSLCRMHDDFPLFSSFLHAYISVSTHQYLIRSDWTTRHISIERFSEINWRMKTTTADRWDVHQMNFEFDLLVNEKQKKRPSDISSGRKRRMTIIEIGRRDCSMLSARKWREELRARRERIISSCQYYFSIEWQKKTSLQSNYECFSCDFQSLNLIVVGRASTSLFPMSACSTKTIFYLSTNYVFSCLFRFEKWLSFPVIVIQINLLGFNQSHRKQSKLGEFHVVFLVCFF